MPRWQWPLGPPLLALWLAARVGASADASQPHPHQGLLSKYERAHPRKIGISMAGVDSEDLRKGEPVLRLLPLPGGYGRAVSVQDIHAPEAVIWSAINDLNNYPKMVDGVVACKVYSQTKNRMSGEVVTCAKYKITAAGWGITYFMKHMCALAHAHAMPPLALDA